MMIVKLIINDCKVIKINVMTSYFIINTLYLINNVKYKSFLSFEFEK